METEVPRSAQPALLESDPYRVLIEALQSLLARGPVLTLVLFVGEAPDQPTPDVAQRIRASMDDVERLMLTCFRRSDRVVRCGEDRCAAILVGAESDGALRAVNRFHRLLGSCPPLAVSLRVGVAAAPEQASESQALLALALMPHLRILPASGAMPDLLPRQDELGENKQAAALSLPKIGGAQEKTRRTPAHLKQTLAISTAAAFAPEPGQRLLRDGGPLPGFETITRARARALGVPYIAPPQRIPSSVRNLLSAEVMRQLRCLPIGRDRGALTVALADPTDRGIVQRLEQLTGLTIFPVMTDPDALEALAKPVRARRASHVAAPASSSSGD